MSRYKITIEYKGTTYAGWQVQDNALSVQEVIEEALANLVGERVKVTSSGRTDSGVHAIEQVAHFDTSRTSIPADRIPYAINPLLPLDISIKTCEIVSEEFHSRYSAKAKTYIYKMYYAHHASPLRDEYYHRLSSKPDLSLMRKAADIMEGEHDFKCFLASGSSVQNTIRTIYSIVIKDYDDEIIIEVKGNGFLYNMVRIIVGTLIDVGNKRIKVQDVYDIIQSRDRGKAGKTLPPNGLYLYKVEY